MSLWTLASLLAVVVNARWFPQKWGKKYCEWPGLEINNGFVCDYRHEFNCTHSPAFVPCMRLQFHLYSTSGEAFGFSCRIQGQSQEFCPLEVYTAERPCIVAHPFEPTPDDGESILCAIDNGNNTDRHPCFTWKHAYIDLCQEDYPHPVTGLMIPRQGRYYRPVDWDHPVIQEDIQKNPQHYLEYIPHSRHPRVQHQPHLLKSRRPKRTIRRRRTLSVEHALAFSGIGERPEMGNFTMDHPDLPVEHEDVSHYEAYPAAIRSEITHHENTQIHTHVFGRFTAGVPEPHHPDLKYIHSYHEHHVSVKRLVPHKGIYVPDYSLLDHYNINGEHNRAYHPDEYDEAREKYEHIFAHQKERQVKALENGFSQYGVVKYHSGPDGPHIVSDEPVSEDIFV